MKSKLVSDDNLTTIYPCLKVVRDSDDRYVVMFTAPKQGFCLSGKVHPIGMFSEKWAEQEFKLYDGIVELSN